MKIELTLKICNIIILICGFAFFFLVGMAFGMGELSLSKIIKTNTTSSCTNLSFQDTVKCLNTDFNQWFKYNLSQSGKTLSEADLKASGGVCSHASEWYSNSAKGLGYESNLITISGTNITEYCVLDQSVILSCIKLEGNGGSGHQFVVVYKND